MLNGPQARNNVEQLSFMYSSNDILALSSNGIQKYWMYVRNEDHHNGKTTEIFQIMACKWLEMLNIQILRKLDLLHF